MSIKNTHKIHLLDKKELEKGDARYLCVKVCYPTFKKSTTDMDKITCKNCLKQLEKEGK